MLPLTLACQVLAGEPVTIRLGTHPGFGRVVFEFAASTSFTLEQTADTAVLHFQSALDIPAAGGTRNITGVVGGAGTATIAIAPGARIRTMQLGNRIVVDVLDPSGTPRAAAAAHEPLPGAAPPAAKPPHAAAAAAAAAAASRLKPVPQAANFKAPEAAMPALAATSPAATSPAVTIPAVTAPAVTIPAGPPAPASLAPESVAPAVLAPPPAPAAVAAPIALAVTRGDMPPGTTGSAALLPFAATVGAAAFRHGAEAWLVFDDRRPLDLSALRGDSILAGATIQLLPAATLLRLPLPADQAVRLTRQPEGWALTAGPAEAAAVPLVPVARAVSLLLAADGAAQVVAVPDPATGKNLLVGTLRAKGPGVPVAYRVPEFTLWPTWQGVVVEPLSDRTDLRVIRDGFTVETGDAMSVTSDAIRGLQDAAVLTRRFDFPAIPAANLLRRLQVQVADEAAAPVQSRLQPRKAVAQTMLALGLGVEAQSLLRLAVTEDPRAAGDPDIAGLSGIAAVLSGRPAEAAGLLSPALTGTDEVALWRAVLAAMQQEGSPEAAQIFAATINLALSYPAALRNRLLPLAAETMAGGGAPEAADALLARLPDEPLLMMAQAIRLEAKGDTAAALTVYDALAIGRNRLLSARAASRAVQLRLASHAIGPADAAAALERGFLDWRGDLRERDLRLRAASLRADAGQWRLALELLRETAQLYPDDSALIGARIGDVLAALLRGPGAAAIPPLDLVTLAEDNAEAVARVAPGEAVALLADKLTELDLPRRAGPVIARMIAATPDGAAQAALGARLAALQLGEGDGAAAAAALRDTDFTPLPPALAEQRGLTDARIHALANDPGGAAAILSTLGTQAADDLRATILAAAGDWRGEAAALQSLAARTIPPQGTLDAAQQDTLLRLASAETRGGDEAASRALGVKEAARMAGPRSDMFRLLTAAPVAGVDDLRRSAGEMALARSIPAALAAIGSH
jgi:hypothetical protein